MIPRLKAAIGGAELAAALKSGHDDLESFERTFASLANQKFAVAFPYGRTALIAILRALDLRDMDIICPSYTCVVVPHAIVYSGNTPVFVDASPSDMNMNLDLLPDVITPRSGAIVATSIFGHPVDLEKLAQNSARIPIIQDCAHSFFASYKGKTVAHDGVCAFYGLNVSKIMTSVFGGMVTTNDEAFFKRLLSEREGLLTRPSWTKSLKRLAYLFATLPAFSRSGYQLVNKLERLGILSQLTDYYDAGEIDMPADYLEQMTALEARVGIVQCGKYQSIVAHRRLIAEAYFMQLENVPLLQLPPKDSEATYSHFVIRSARANDVIRHCLTEGIQLGEIIEYDIPTMPAYQNHQSIGHHYSRTLPGNVINLPVHTGVSLADAISISDTIKKYLSS